jgi:hypothetical protein
MSIIDIIFRKANRKNGSTKHASTVMLALRKEDILLYEEVFAESRAPPFLFKKFSIIPTSSQKEYSQSRLIRNIYSL